MSKEEDEAMREAHWRNFLKQGLEATKGITEGSLPRIEYTANKDGSVSEKTTWVKPKEEQA